MTEDELAELIEGSRSRAADEFPLAVHREALVAFGVCDPEPFWGEIAWQAVAARATWQRERDAPLEAPTRLAARLKRISKSLGSVLADLEKLEAAQTQAAILMDMERLKALSRVEQQILDVFGVASECRDDLRSRFARWRGDTHGIGGALSFAAELVVVPAHARRRGQTTPRRGSLKFAEHMVEALAEIWERMLARPASAERVERKQGGAKPDFVRFVQFVAGIGNVPRPTIAQVKTVLTHRKAALAESA